MTVNNLQLIKACKLALAGEWDQSHRIVQDLTDPMSCWIHAVLHKIEGDVWNSRYWYARTTGKQYEDYSTPNFELEAIHQSLEQ